MRILAAFAFICLVSLPAAAQNCDRNDETQAAMNICAEEDSVAADAELNKAYAAIIKKLGDDKESRDLLKKSQRAWISFRDAECEFQTWGADGGTMGPMLYSQCLQSLTEARTVQLEAYLNCEEGDLSCSIGGN